MTNDPWKFGPHTMPGQLCSKSNSRRLVNFGSRPAIIKSQDSLDYMKLFCRLFWTAKAYEGDIALFASCYYKDKRRDLDVALLQDALQKANVIKNDRQVKEIHAWRYIDREKPRTEFTLRAI